MFFEFQVFSEGEMQLWVGAAAAMLIDLVVEISRLRRGNIGNSDFSADDFYYVSVVEILKNFGDVSVGDELRVLFHADTVSIGEQHIVATRTSTTGAHWFTSRYSLFCMSQLDEITQILNTLTPLELSCPH